jgi:ABC-type multidrug transport system fused ATPase/permease subunit
MPFLLRYVKRHRAIYITLAVIAVVAALSEVAVQLAMKMLVDGMAAKEGAGDAVALALTLFIGLIAAESILWRFKLSCDNFRRNRYSPRPFRSLARTAHPFFFR